MKIVNTGLYEGSRTIKIAVREFHLGFSKKYNVSFLDGPFNKTKKVTNTSREYENLTDILERNQDEINTRFRKDIESDLSDDTFTMEV